MPPAVRCAAGALPSVETWPCSLVSARWSVGEALAGRLDLGEIHFGMDLGGEIVGAEDRREQAGDRLAVAVLDLGLDGELALRRAGRRRRRRLRERRRPFWSTTETPSGARPGTEEATRLTIAWTWLSPSVRPGGEREHHRGGGVAASRTKTLGCSTARWTRAVWTASIASMVRARSASRAARIRSVSTARLDAERHGGEHVAAAPGRRGAGPARRAACGRGDNRRPRR